MFSHKKIMQDERKHWRSVKIDLNKSRHTISWMPGKRHRKSLYCRHREQLWGDKKGNWYYWDCWYPSLTCLPVSLYVSFTWEEKQRTTEWERELACPFINMSANQHAWKWESSRLSEEMDRKVVEEMDVSAEWQTCRRSDDGLWSEGYLSVTGNHFSLYLFIYLFFYFFSFKATFHFLGRN